MTRTTRTLAATALALVGVALPTGTAHASAPSAPERVAHSTVGSLVFLKDYNVWIARADGSQARALTTDGTFESQYATPSQADDGTVVAGHAGLIYRMTPSGRVLGTMDPPALKNSVGHFMDGTPAVAISPNGKLIAYTQSLFECPPAADCATRFATAYTASDHLTEPDRHGVTEYDSPSWIGNDRTVQGGGQLAEINLHDIDDDPVHWFRDSEIQNGFDDLSDPAVSRDGALVATIAGFGDHTSVLWSEVNGSVKAGSDPELPTPLCQTNALPDIAGPAFSADSDTLAWSLDGDLWMVRDPHQCNQPEKVISGATEASFSAAPFSVPAPESVTAPRATGTARVGRTLSAAHGSWTMHPTYAYQWLRDGHVVRGATRASYRVVKADAGHRLAVRVSAKGDGGTTRATSAAVRVRP